MTDQTRDVPEVRGYMVFREEEPGLWKLAGDVDYQPGLTARAERIRAVTDVVGAERPARAGYAALPRDQWHVLRHA